MRILEFTLPTPAENLAFDEDLLARDNPLEYLRLWESPTPIVVVGRSSKLEVEVNERACLESNVPIVRRVSGGAAIVTGPGCLMYAVVLDLERRPELAMVDRAHAWVLGQTVQALRPLVANVSCAGTSDLVLLPEAQPSLGESCGDPGTTARKFSGNSIRLKRTRLLYHGTLLYDFDLTLIPRLLYAPPRQPDYRNGRAHEQFVTNLPIDGETLRRALTGHWTKV
jgi:lipoate-protein ligase A